jgi:hypothetical protein
MLVRGEPLDQYGGDESAMTDGVWAEIGVNWSLSNANPRTGAWHLRMANSSAGPARITLGAAKAVAGMATAVFLSALPSSEFNVGVGGVPPGLMIHQYRSASNQIQLSIAIGTDGSLVVWRYGFYDGGGSGIGELMFRSDQCIRANSYQHIESKIGVDPVDGFVEVRVDGVTRVNLTGVNTDPYATGEVSQVAVWNPGVGAPGCVTDVCDIICWDDQGTQNNDFVGDQKVWMVPVAGDTAVADWTPSTGATSWNLLDETPPNDADGISLTATTGKTVLTTAGSPAGMVSCIGAVSWLRGSKDDAGVCDLAPGVRQGATYGASVGQPITTSKQYYTTVYELDPVSGLPPSPSDIDTLELVVERTA